VIRSPVLVPDNAHIAVVVDAPHYVAPLSQLENVNLNSFPVHIQPFGDGRHRQILVDDAPQYGVIKTFIRIQRTAACYHGDT
jgi:hypothetical protein